MKTTKELSIAFFKSPIIVIGIVIFAIAFVASYMFVFFSANVITGGHNIIPNSVFILMAACMALFGAIMTSAMIHNKRQYVAFLNQFNVLDSNIDKCTTADQLFELRQQFIDLYRKYMGLFGVHQKIDQCIVTIDARVKYEFKF